MSIKKLNNNNKYSTLTQKPLPTSEKKNQADIKYREF